MSQSQTFVIIGAGLAGAKAAEALRDGGFEGRVVLIGEESVRPYERPPLSKDYLRGESDFDAAAVHAPDYYEANEIDLITSTKATGIDTKSAVVTLDTSEQIAYDSLLITTGSEPRRLSIPGSELDGVHYLRTVGDSDALRGVIQSSEPLVVIGAGWIGAEVAASARQLGSEVAMVELGAVPVERVLGLEVGTMYKELHAEHGVALHFGVSVESIRGAGRVEEVRLTDGRSLPAGAVVVGVGVLPRTSLAEAAGIVTDNGITTDQYLRTSNPNVYAAGDVAESFYPLWQTHIRLEHWSAALNQGPVAGRNMLGADEPYDKMPYFYSDQYDIGMEYRGWARAFDEVVFRGDRSKREFLVFWLNQGIVAAGMNVNVWDQGDAIEAVIRARHPVDPARLADPEVDLTELASGTA